MAGERELLEKHTLIVRDGRILEILPSETAEQHYAPRVSLERPSHLLMPGLVNAHTSIGSLPGAGGAAVFSPDLAALGIANMLKAGVTAFCDVGIFRARLPARQSRRVCARSSDCLWRLAQAPGPMAPRST